MLGLLELYGVYPKAVVTSELEIPVMYPTLLYNSEILSFGCKAVAPNAAPFLISVKSDMRSCLALSAFCKSVWSDNVPLIFPHSALVCVFEINTLAPEPVILIPVPALSEVNRSCLFATVASASFAQYLAEFPVGSLGSPIAHCLASFALLSAAVALASASVALLPAAVALAAAFATSASINAFLAV